MQPPLPAPSATGSFVKTPFPHLLVYALERRLTGTFELFQGAAVVATILVIGGCPAKVRIAEPIHYLGDILLELGMIDPGARAASLQKMQAEGKLQGQALLELGAIDPARLDAGLRAQVERKIERLFGLPGETTFSYYDNVDLLSNVGGGPSAIDPFPVLWRGVREHPPLEHVDATLRRIGAALIRASAMAQLARFAFAPAEIPGVELLQQRPVRVADVTALVGPHVGPLLVYLLMIMKQVDLVDPAQAQSQARPGHLGAPPSSGQAFARVQLQKVTPRGPLIVEEVHVASTHDERASHPVTAAAPMVTPGSAFAPVPAPQITITSPPTSEAPAPGSPRAGDEAPSGPMDIGSLISHTIHSSGPPAAANQAPAIPPPANTNPDGAGAPGADEAGVNPASMPPGSIPPGAAAPLTAEQSILKAKILERAEQITSQDYFQMLGAPRDATTEQLQKAFIALAKVWHPDRLPPALVDVKDACSKVFAHLTEAHATLTDPPRRQDYMTLLREGGATPDDQAKIQAILEAATEFQKAEILLKRSMSDPQAYEIVSRCVMLDGEQADYLATLAWLDAQKPEWLSREKTLEKCLVLERCIQKNQHCERAYFYRGMLYKRAGESSKALKDFKRAAELNPRNLDAMREVRLHKMRGGASGPPAAGATASSKSGGAKPAETESLGGLLGKLFKK
jgi:tetratricopeptide (TPR) repeat protein